MYTYIAFSFSFNLEPLRFVGALSGCSALGQFRTLSLGTPTNQLNQRTHIYTYLHIYICTYVYVLVHEGYASDCVIFSGSAFASFKTENIHAKLACNFYKDYITTLHIQKEHMQTYIHTHPCINFHESGLLDIAPGIEHNVTHIHTCAYGSLIHLTQTHKQIYMYASAII